MARIRRMSPDEYALEAQRSVPGCHLYVIQEGDEGPTKVGIARNAFWRRNDLQTGNYRRLGLAAVFVCQGRQDAILVEAAVLTHFSGVRLSGEWLDCGPAPVISFIVRESGCGAH